MSIVVTMYVVSVTASHSCCFYYMFAVVSPKDTLMEVLSSGMLLAPT